MKLQQLIDDARAHVYEAVRDEILSSPGKTHAAIAYDYGITQVTVWKIAKTLVTRLHIICVWTVLALKKPHL